NQVTHVIKGLAPPAALLRLLRPLCSSSDLPCSCSALSCSPPAFSLLPLCSLAASFYLGSGSNLSSLPSPGCNYSLVSGTVNSRANTAILDFWSRGTEAKAA